MIYSKQETKLLKYFGIKDHLLNDRLISPQVIYRMAVEKAFISNDRSKYSQSLRKVYLAFQNGKIYRNTPEWESLIKDI